MNVCLIEALERKTLLSFTPIQIGARNYDSGFEVAAVGGDTIVAGVFQGTIDLGVTESNFAVVPPITVKLTARGETDIYIARYNADGVLKWAGNIGGVESENEEQLPIDPTRASRFVNRIGIQPDFLGEYVNGIAVDPNDGSIYMAGTFFHTADFDPGLGVFELTANSRYNLYDAFLIKLDGDGNLLWAKSFGGEFNDVINGVAIDPQGNPVVTGYFTRRADFDPGPAEFAVDVLGRDDIFVAKYTAAAGKFVWVRTFGSDETRITDRDSGNGIAIDSVGNIFITGSFSGATDFDPGPSEVYLEAERRTDAFLLALSPPGKFVFARSFGGGSFDGGMKIALRSNGEIYTASYFTGEVDVDPGPAMQVLVSAGDDRHNDLLISKYTADGSFLWAKQMGGEEYETIGGFAVDDDGAVYTSGGFNGRADFDPGPGTFFLNSVRGDDDFDDPNDGSRDFSYDIYVSRLSARGKFLGATRIGSSGDDFGAGLAVRNDGSLVLTGQFRNTVAFDPATDSVKRRSRGVQDGFLIGLTDELELLA